MINFVATASDEQGFMKFLHMVTSEGNEFKWGSSEGCSKNEQKSIRKYESLVLRGRLVQITDRDAPNYYCLAGITLTIIYLSPR